MSVLTHLTYIVGSGVYSTYLLIDTYMHSIKLLGSMCDTNMQILTV